MYAEGTSRREPGDEKCGGVILTRAPFLQPDQFPSTARTPQLKTGHGAYFSLGKGMPSNSLGSRLDGPVLEGRSLPKVPTYPCLRCCSARRVRTTTFWAGGILSGAYALVNRRVKRNQKYKENERIRGSEGRIIKVKKREDGNGKRKREK